LSVVTHPVWARNTVTIITIEQKQKKSKLIKCLKSAVMAKKKFVWAPDQQHIIIILSQESGDYYPWVTTYRTAPYLCIF